MRHDPMTLSQLNGRRFLTDGGLETTLVFVDGLDLPCFAAFPLIDSEDGRERLRRYYQPYLRTAARAGMGFVLCAPTWRANPDWGARLGYAEEGLRRINRDAIALMQELRRDWASDRTPILVEGAIGPRGDGYRPADRMSAEEAEAYHAAQVSAFREAGADLVGAYTLNYTEEATGIVRAAASAGLPVAVSFTVETDGRLPSGETLGEAIEEVDADTDGGPAYFMINCAHPSHFEGALVEGGTWTRRIRGIRANASTMSHAELDGASELDSGDPADLGQRYAALLRRFPQMAVLGGCCGTDHRHVAAICEACLDFPPGAASPWAA